jgi:hypothetical protein
MLPVEVLSHIFEYIDPISLTRCCLVSHDFDEIAAPALYRSITINVSGAQFDVGSIYIYNGSTSQSSIVLLESVRKTSPTTPIRPRSQIHKILAE